MRQPQPTRRGDANACSASRSVGRFSPKERSRWVVRYRLTACFAVSTCVPIWRERVAAARRCVCRAATRRRKRAHIVRDIPSGGRAARCMAGASLPRRRVTGGCPRDGVGGGGVLSPSRVLPPTWGSGGGRGGPPPPRRDRSVRFDQFEVAEAARPTRRGLRAQALVEDGPGSLDSFATAVALVDVALDWHLAPSAAAAQKLPIRKGKPDPSKYGAALTRDSPACPRSRPISLDVHWSARVASYLPVGRAPEE